MRIQIKRAYEAPAAGDGVRVLIDRLWPRGVSKSKAGIDHWFKELAPSNALRKWFGHDPAKWKGFRTRYFKEIGGKADQAAELKRLSRKSTLTLVYGARDEEHNNAAALRDYLQGKTRKA